VSSFTTEFLKHAHYTDINPYSKQQQGTYGKNRSSFNHERLILNTGYEAKQKQICEEYLGERYQIEVVDLMKNPELARGDQIFAFPTLAMKLPEPVRKIIGKRKA
jgi:hypothetical protein